MKLVGETCSREMMVKGTKDRGFRGFPTVHSRRMLRGWPSESVDWEMNHMGRATRVARRKRVLFVNRRLGALFLLSVVLPSVEF